MEAAALEDKNSIVVWPNVSTWTSECDPVCPRGRRSVTTLECDPMCPHGRRSVTQCVHVDVGVWPRRSVTQCVHVDVGVWPSVSTWTQAESRSTLVAYQDCLQVTSLCSWPVAVMGFVWHFIFRTWHNGCRNERVKQLCVPLLTLCPPGPELWLYLMLSSSRNFRKQTHKCTNTHT